MKIHVGSKNATKLEAIQELITQYDCLSGAEVTGIDVPIEEFGHPKTLEETFLEMVAKASR